MKTNDVTITDIQRFCMHDGPGVRTTVFFKGCPLSCVWCHNPETKQRAPELSFSPVKCIGCRGCADVCENNVHGGESEHTLMRERCTVCGACAGVCPTRALEIIGESMSITDIMREVMKDAPFYGKDGGLTVSGGEPTAQAEGLLSLLEAAKSEGIGTCVETCGVFHASLVPRLAPLTDLFLFDVKDTDAARLKANTGADLGAVLSNLRLLDSAGAETVMRCIIVPGVNMNTAHYDALCEIFASLSHVRYIELLPYHPYGTSKAEGIGIASPAVYAAPEKGDVYAAAEYIKNKGVPVKCYGTVQ